MAYSVSQRTGEIGLRMALGAQSRDILRLVLAHGLTLIAVGLVLGLFGAYAITRALSGTLYRISPTDPFTRRTAGLLSSSALGHARRSDGGASVRVKHPQNQL